jgi:DNA-binding PadR family transcriptional regulator
MAFSSFRVEELISRTDELVLICLSAHPLGANASQIRTMLETLLGDHIRVGALFPSLKGLEKTQRIMTTYDPVSSPRGVPKKRYRITTQGEQALAQVRVFHDQVWRNFPSFGSLGWSPRL